MASLKEHGDVHVAARLPWESTRLVLSVLQLHNVTSDVGDLLFQIFHLPSKAVCEGAHGGSLLRYVRRLGRGFANKFLGRIWLMSEVKALFCLRTAGTRLLHNGLFGFWTPSLKLLNQQMAT